MAARKSLVPIALPADPVNALEAATKQYVDGRLACSIGLSYDLQPAGNYRFQIGPNLPVTPYAGLWFCLANGMIWTDRSSVDAYLMAYTDAYTEMGTGFGYNVWSKGGDAVDPTTLPGYTAAFRVGQSVWRHMGHVSHVAPSAAGGRPSLNVQVNQINPVAGNYSFRGFAECFFFPGPTHASVTIGPS